MVEAVNIIGGTAVIILNLIPFILKKTQYLLLTAILSFIILFVIAQGLG